MKTYAYANNLYVYKIIVNWYNGILPTNKKECNADSWNDIGKSQNQCVK